MEGLLYHKYRPNPTHDTVTVPILPPNLQKDALIHNHDAATAGHFGAEKTLAYLCRVALINMAKDVAEYCRQCVKCQQLKLNMPQRAPLQIIPIRKPWQMGDTKTRNTE